MLSRGSRNGRKSGRQRLYSNRKKKEKAMHRIVASLTLSLALFGCMVGPDYQRPQVDVPQIWRVEDKSVQAVTNTSWWEQYNDPVLNGLVQRALEEKKERKIAGGRIDQVFGFFNKQGGGHF